MQRSDYFTVTQVLSPYAGMDKIPAHILQEASNRGTIVHTAIAGELSELGSFYPTELSGYMDSFNQIKRKISNIKCIEERYFDDTLQITGQCDLICDFEGIPTLIDWKTSTKEGSTWRYQIAAYENLARNHGLHVDQMLVVKLDRYAKEPVIYKYSDENFQTFLECLKLYKLFFLKTKEVNHGSI